MRERILEAMWSSEADYEQHCRLQNEKLREIVLLKNERRKAEERIAELEAACAAMRSVMADAKMTLQMLHPNMNPEEPCNVYQTWSDIKCILASDAGRAVQERMVKLEKVAEAAKQLVAFETSTGYMTAEMILLESELAELEGGAPGV